MGLIDLVFLVPLTHYIIVLSGGSTSYLKFLYIPLIISNALKPAPYYGIIATAASMLSLVLLGTGTLAEGGMWPVEDDLVLLSTFILINWLVRYFISVEDELYEKLLLKATTDELTGLYNHRFMHGYLEKFGIEKTKVVALADRIRSMIEIVCRKFISGHGFDPKKMPITASVGIAAADSLTKDKYKLIKEADHAMYQAKADGKNQVKISSS